MRTNARLNPRIAFVVLALGVLLSSPLVEAGEKFSLTLLNLEPADILFCSLYVTQEGANCFCGHWCSCGGAGGMDARRAWKRA